MKIVLHATKEELLQLLSRATNSAITDFVVLKGSKTVDILTPILVKMANSLAVPRVDPNAPCPISQKIPYIKALREATRDCLPNIMGLGDAKAAVENWIQYCNFIRINGRLPIVRGGAWGESLSLS